MNEPTNIWTKSYNKILAHMTIESSIIFDIGEQGDMYEGTIAVYFDNRQFSMKSKEYQDSLTFDTEGKARGFINDCLEKWGLNYVLFPRLFNYDSPPKTLLEIRSIRESYEKEPQNPEDEMSLADFNQETAARRKI